MATMSESQPTLVCGPWRADAAEDGGREQGGENSGEQDADAGPQQGTGAVVSGSCTGGWFRCVGHVSYFRASTSMTRTTTPVTET